MPIDARVPLSAISSGRSAFDFDLLGMARQATALHTEQAQMREQARKAQAQQAFQQAVTEADGDYDLALDLLDKRGHGDTALSLRGELQKYRTEAFKTLEQQTTARTKELALFSSLANLITDDESQALVLNSLSPELRATASRALGDTFDPQRAQTARDTLLSEADRTARQKHAFELMKDARDFAAGTPERKAKEALALGQYLSATQTPEEYAQTLQRAPELGISRDVARLFQGKTAQQAAQIAITPEKRADLAMRAVDDERQSARDAETRRHNRVMENKPAAADNALVAIVGPDGKPVYVPRSQAVGKTPASTRESGGGRGVTSGDANRLADFDTSLDDVTVLRKTVSGNKSTGTRAAVGAALPNFVTEATGIGQSAKEKQAVIDRVKQVIGKALEGGVLRKEDEYKYTKILPTISDTPETVKAKLDGLESALKHRKDRLLDSLDDAGYNTESYRSRAPKPAQTGGSGEKKVGRFTVREK
jgi:hypothetical protein